MKKCINLKPHEAAALARGETITIWRALSRPLTEFPDGRWSWIVDSTERTHRDMWVYGWTDPSGHRYTERGRESCEHFREPFPLNVPLLGKETWCEASPEHRDHANIPQAFYKTASTEAGEEIRQEYIRLGHDYRWKSASQMPSWAVRTLVTLSDVRVRKPCDVTPQEALSLHNQIDWHLYHWSYTATPSQNLS